MKQSIVDVIAYLLEIATTQKTDPVDLFSDQGIVGQRLEEAGFSQDTVLKAFDWLQELIEQQQKMIDEINAKLEILENN